MKRRRAHEKQSLEQDKRPIKKPRTNSNWWGGLFNFSWFKQSEQLQPEDHKAPISENPIPELPAEILLKIVSIVSEPQLREVSHTFAESFDDLLWRQMKRQHQIPPRLSPADELDTLAEKQQHEISYLQKWKKAVVEITENNRKIEKAYEKLEKITEKTTIALYAKEKLLNFINETLIRKRIVTYKNVLNCSDCHLTRFPEVLIVDREIPFLENLQRLTFNLKDHLFQDTLSMSFWKNLQQLSLDHNQLTTVPESLSQLNGLQWLSLRDNQLTSVPQSLGQLEDLQGLDLTMNHLNALPDTISDKILFNGESRSWITKELVLQTQKEESVCSEKKIRNI